MTASGAIQRESSDGQTPLIIAAAGGHAQVVELLLGHGADRYQRWMGLLAADVALEARTQSWHRKDQGSHFDDILQALNHAGSSPPRGPSFEVCMEYSRKPPDSSRTRTAMVSSCSPLSTTVAIFPFRMDP